MDKTNAIVLSHSAALAHAAAELRASPPSVRPWLLEPSPLSPSSRVSPGAHRLSDGPPSASASAPGRPGAGGGAAGPWWCGPAGRPAPTCSSSPSCCRSPSSSAPLSPPPASPTTSTSASSGRWRSTRPYWRRTRHLPREAVAESWSETRPSSRRWRRSKFSSRPPATAPARAPGTGRKGKCISLATSLGKEGK